MAMGQLGRFHVGDAGSMTWAGLHPEQSLRPVSGGARRCSAPMQSPIE